MTPRLTCTPAPHQRDVQSSLRTYFYPNLHCSMIWTQKHIWGWGKSRKANLPEPHVPPRDGADANMRLDVSNHPDDWISPLFAWPFALGRQSYSSLGFGPQRAPSCMLCVTLCFASRVGHTYPSLRAFFFPPVPSQPN